MSDRELLLADDNTLSKEDWFKQRDLHAGMFQKLKDYFQAQGCQTTNELLAILDKLSYEDRVNLLYPESES